MQLLSRIQNPKCKLLFPLESVLSSVCFFQRFTFVSILLKEIIFCLWSCIPATGHIHVSSSITAILCKTIISKVQTLLQLFCNSDNNWKMDCRWVRNALWMERGSRDDLTQVKIYMRNKENHLALALAPACTHPRMCTIVLTGLSLYFYNPSNGEVCCFGHYWNRLLACTSSFFIDLFFHWLIS